MHATTAKLSKALTDKKSARFSLIRAGFFKEMRKAFELYVLRYWQNVDEETQADDADDDNYVRTKYCPLPLTAIKDEFYSGWKVSEKRQQHCCECTSTEIGCLLVR